MHIYCSTTKAKYKINNLKEIGIRGTKDNLLARRKMLTYEDENSAIVEKGIKF